MQEHATTYTTRVPEIKTDLDALTTFVKKWALEKMPVPRQIAGDFVAYSDSACLESSRA